MKNLYGMKRPFGIGTFPKVDRVEVKNTDYREVGFYNIVETVEPLSYDDIDAFELCVLNEDNSVLYKYGQERK